MSRLIVLRPEPGASSTKAKALAMGLCVDTCPLFRIEPTAWTPPPPTDFDALLITSAQAIRSAGINLARYRDLPAYAVGQATAAALRTAGFTDVTAGDANAAAITSRIAADGHRAILHLAGADVAPFDPGPLHIRRVVVYATVIAAGDAILTPLLAPKAVLMVHSARAGERLDKMVDRAERGQLNIVAISAAALVACGTGWSSAQAAPTPDDTAMLALAALLCKGHSHATDVDGGTGPLDHQ